MSAESVRGATLRRRWGRVVAVGALAPTAWLIPSAAQAHVEVTPSSTAPGEYTVLTFTVPVESTTAATVGLTVNFPADTPFGSVAVQPVPGWTAKVTTGTLPKPVKGPHGNTITSAVTKVTWNATAGGLKPGEFGQFAVSAGPLPKSGTVYFPALQSYSDGTSANWAQRAQGNAEAQLPAPEITIGAPVAAEQVAAPADDKGDGVGLPTVAIGVGIAGLLGLLGGVAFSRTRR